MRSKLLKIVKKVKTLPYVGGSLFLSVGEALASHRQIIAPFKAKGSQIEELIVEGFGIICAIALVGIIAVWGFTRNDAVKQKMEDWGKRLVIAGILMYGVGKAALMVFLKG